MALLKSTNIIGNLSATGNIIASKFILNGGDNNSLLLAGGNTKLISDFATSAQMTAANTSINNLSSGKVGKADNNTLSGTNTFSGQVIISNTTDATLASASGALRIGDTAGQHLAIDGNEIMSKSTASAAGILYLNNEGGLVQIGSGGLSVGGNITPSANNSKTLGTSDVKWSNVYATTFTGALSGNATTATKWATARTLTIGATGKSINGTADATWTPYEMRVTRAQYNIGSNMNQIADHGCELGMASLEGTDTTINPNGGTSWHHYINMTWSDTSDNNSTTNNEWCTQIANKVGTTDLWVRSRSGGSITDGSAWVAPWTRILTGSNWTSVVDGRYLKLDGGGTMTGSPVIKFPASAGAIATSDPMAITYGRISAYGTLCINADSDGSTTEHLILTAGKGLSNSTADGLAIGHSTLTWQNKAIINTGNGGTANYIPKFTAANTIENSSISDNGTQVLTTLPFRSNSTITAYQYSQTNKDWAAFIFDKPGGNWTGIGAHAINDLIHFGPCSNTGEWVGIETYKQIWNFQGVVRSQSGFQFAELPSAWNAKFEYNSGDKCIDIIFT